MARPVSLQDGPEIFARPSSLPFINWFVFADAAVPGARVLAGLPGANPIFVLVPSITANTVLRVALDGLASWGTVRRALEVSSHRVEQSLPSSVTS